MNKLVLLLFFLFARETALPQSLNSEPGRTYETPRPQAAEQRHLTPPDKTARTVKAKLGDVFVVTDIRDLKLLRIAEGAKMSNTTLPSGKVVPVPPEGTIWRVRKGKIVLEEDK